MPPDSCIGKTSTDRRNIYHDSSTRSLRRSVTWGNLEVLEFPNELGDNPGVSTGAPLTIGWKPNSREVMGIDYFEFVRITRPRRKRRELMMNSSSRDTYLLGLGYSLEELMDAADATKKIKKSRQNSMKGTMIDKFRGFFDRSSSSNSVLRSSSGRQTSQPKIVAGKSA